MPRISGEPADGVQAVSLALRIIEQIAAQPEPIGVTALANTLGVTKSRVFRHLRTLEQSEYLRQETETERYGVGPKLVLLSRAVDENVNVIHAAMPVLRRLRDQLGHFSVFSQIESDGVRIMATMAGRSAIQIGVRQGSLLPFHASAQGKVALAFSEPEVIDRVLRGHLPMSTPYTLSGNALRRALRETRARGWATACNEALIGLNALAAPIFAPGGAILGAVAAVDSAQFIEAEPSPDQVRAVMAAGAEISRALGYAGARDGAS